MFREIGIATGRCHFCATWGTVAVLAAPGVAAPYQVKGCEKCWRATGNAATLLRVVRLGRSPKAKAAPKKPRRRATGQPSETTAYQGPAKHEVSSLVPPAEERSA
jgi:hypothetical protein